MVKAVEIGVSRYPLDADELEEIMTKFEEKLRAALRKRLRRRLESLDILVEASIDDEGRLTVKVDVAVTGRYIAPYSYDEVVAEAIDEAASWLESELRARVARKKGNGAERPHSEEGEGTGSSSQKC